jgi:hypothetical protein
MNLEPLKGKWKSARIRIHGELYFFRHTLDLGESGDHLYGFEVTCSDDGWNKQLYCLDLAGAVELVHITRYRHR